MLQKPNKNIFHFYRRLKRRPQARVKGRKLTLAIDWYCINLHNISRNIYCMNWMKGRMTLYINIDRNQWTLYKLNELQKADGYISSERLYQRVTVMSGSLGSRVLSRRGDLRCQNIRPNVSNLTINRWATKLMYHSFSINRLFYRSNYSNKWGIIFWMLIRCTLLKPPLCF